MIFDCAPVSSWYVLNQGFKVYEKCTACNSQNIQYHKARIQGHSGILAKCQGCEKQFPVRFRSTQANQNKVVNF